MGQQPAAAPLAQMGVCAGMTLFSLSPGVGGCSVTAISNSGDPAPQAPAAAALQPKLAGFVRWRARRASGCNARARQSATPKLVANRTVSAA
jgi:hypothetical protein